MGVAEWVIEEMTKIECYCSKAECGDPIPSSGYCVETRYTKRRMQFTGWKFGIVHRAVATYKCPVCGKQRVFQNNLLNNGWHEV